MKLLARFLFVNLLVFCVAYNLDLAEPLTGNHSFVDWFWLCTAMCNLVFMVIVTGRYAWHFVEDGR